MYYISMWHVSVEDRAQRSIPSGFSAARQDGVIMSQAEALCTPVLFLAAVCFTPGGVIYVLPGLLRIILCVEI